MLIDTTPPCQAGNAKHRTHGLLRFDAADLVGMTFLLFFLVWSPLYMYQRLSLYIRTVISCIYCSGPGSRFAFFPKAVHTNRSHTPAWESCVLVFPGPNVSAGKNRMGLGTMKIAITS